MGAVVGGMAGYAKYGVKGILPGLLQGGINGALTGAAFGGLGGFGGIAGELFGCSEFMVGLFAVSSTLSLSMLAFDSLALLYDFQARFEMDTDINLHLIDSDAGRAISELNKKAHGNSWYNAFQLFAGATTAFSGGYVRYSTCFIAGTLVATTEGLLPIECINVGDKVLSANPETCIAEEKTVRDTFHSAVTELVHLVIDGECFISTHNHPFYVDGNGFVEAGKLRIGDCLYNKDGDKHILESISFESLEHPVEVYNIEVEDYHTYYVGVGCIFVHNKCVGENGTQTPNTKTWKRGKTERLEVENPNPGQRDGNIHYHDANNHKYYYDIENKYFVDAKTGNPAPKSVQNLVNNYDFAKGIEKALNVLGEKIND